MEAVLLKLLEQAKVAGSTASLSFTTVGETLKAKFEIYFASTSSPWQQVQSQLRPALLQEKITATADVDAIVDQQLWLTRPPWQCHHHHRRILPVLSSSIPLRHLLLGGGK